MRFWILAGVILYNLFFNGSVDAAEKEKVHRMVVAEFDSSGAGNFKYLRNSIQTMLVSRLAADEDIEIVDLSLTEQQVKSLRKGGSLGSMFPAGERPEYLMEGTLFALKDGLNTQIVLYPAAGQGKVLRFSVLTRNVNSLIGDIEGLSTDIVAKAFGAQDEKIARPAPSSEARGDSGFMTEHPEIAYKRQQYRGTVAGVESGALDVKMIGGKQTAAVAGEVEIFTVGDIDDDGRDEMIMLTSSTIKVYDYVEQQLVLRLNQKMPVDLRCHAARIAAVGKDKHNKLYLSATNGLRPASMILSWNGKGFSALQQNMPWYIRPVAVPGKGCCLLGQKRGRDKLDLVSPGIYILALNGKNSYEPQGQISIPENTNLFNFVFADIDGDRGFETVTIDRKEKMRVYNAKNELLWVSTGTYGGSRVYIGPSRSEAVTAQSNTGFTLDEDEMRELIYVPGELVVQDVDGNGSEEIVVSEQDSTSVPLFTRLRFYNSGSIVGLEWRKDAMEEMWKTSKFKGYLAGYSLVAEKSGARHEKRGTSASLYALQIPDSGTLMSFLPGKSESLFTVYQLTFNVSKDK